MSRMNCDMMQDLLYMQALQPDEGYEVDFAMGTTFSLSMEGLVSIPLALSNMGDTKKPSDQTAMYLMEGIRRASDKFILFCNKGSIHIPADCLPLYSLLEQTVVEVKHPDCPLANFHPKMWMIRQKPIEGNREDIMKLIIMSKNLTFSSNLDSAIIIKGKVKKNVYNHRNKALHDFIVNLAENYIKENCKKELIINLAKDFQKVEQFDLEAPFSSTVFELHPYMLNTKEASTTYNATPMHLRLQGRRVLIVSPFLDIEPDKGILSLILQNAENAYLVTCPDNVTTDVLNMFNEVYVPNTMIAYSELGNVDLHAKMYIIEQTNGTVYMYIGSANATTSAFRHNAELSMGIRVNAMSFDEIKESLGIMNNASDSLYIKVSEPLAYNIEEEKQKRVVKNELEYTMRWAMACVYKAKVVKHNKKDHPFEVTVQLKNADPTNYRIANCTSNYKIRIRPLQCKNEWRELKDNINWNLELEDLSEFYVIEVINIQYKESHKSGVYKIETEGLLRLKDQRNDSIVSSAIKSDNIIQYIELILSDFPESTFEKWNQHNKETIKKRSDTSKSWTNVTIYEQLLKASYDNPQKLEYLRKIFSKLTIDDYPNEMISIFKTFGITLKCKNK